MMNQSDRAPAIEVGFSIADDRSLQSPPFCVGTIVCRSGYSGFWEVATVLWDHRMNTWLIGVVGQRNGWPAWPASEFVICSSPPIAFALMS